MGFSRLGTRMRLTYCGIRSLVFVLLEETEACFSLVMEADLADVHATILFEIGPGRVDDGDVVFFVSWATGLDSGVDEQMMEG